MREKPDIYEREKQILAFDEHARPESCSLCITEEASCCYDFKRLCCRVRFIMSLGDKQRRVGWLDLWKKEGQHIYESVKKGVEAAWLHRKK